MGGGYGNFPTEGEEDEKAEDWCFVCKDGGSLLLCDHKNCPKAYHPRCVGKKKSFLTSKEHWECAWHSCLNCGNPSNLCCYLCPKSVCQSCMDPKYFFHIKGKYGFCDECSELAEDIEKEIDVDDLSMEYFKEYYEFVKKQEGFDLYSLRSAKGLEMKKVHRPTSNSGDAVVHYRNNDQDKSVVSKKNGKLVEDKICEKLQKRKFNCVEVFDEDPVTWGGPKTHFASIIAENLRLVYLTKSFVLELLKKPESFESKVIGSFVRVKSAFDGDCQCNSYQLVQVAGITNDSSGSSPVKLQLRDIPSDVCIDLLSDASFTEEECEALRQKFEAGLFDKPTVEGLELKAKDLHSDLTKHMIAREKKTLQYLIDNANEKGRRYKLMEYLERKERLETESEVRRMLNTPPKVIAEVPNVKPVANDTTDDKKRKKGLPKTHYISVDVEDTNETLDQNHKSRYDDSLASNLVKGTKGTSVNDTGCVVEDEVIQESFSHRIDLQEKNISNLSTRSPKKSNVGKCWGDVALDWMLDGLIKPDLANCCSNSVPSEAVHHIIKGCILSLKEIPIANYKDMMIPLADGFFFTLRNLNVDYTQLYGRVKEYIWRSAQLACIDNSKIGPTAEELTATYKEKKMCYEKNSEAFNVMSNSLHVSDKQVSEGHNEAAVSEVSGERSEHVSRISSMIKMSEELEKSKKEMVQALYALDNSRKKWLEEEKVKEDFMNAKAALVW